MRITGILVLILLLLVGCGNEAQDYTKLNVETEDIKGTIIASPDNISDLSQNSNGFNSKGKTLEFHDKGEIKIYLIKDDLTTIKQQLTNSSINSEFEILEKGENHFTYYLEKTSIDGEVVKGYGFRVISPYDEDTFTCLDGQGVLMFDPIATEEINQELLEIALTFKKK